MVVAMRSRKGRKVPGRREEQSCDLTNTPPPPLFKILDSNRSRRHLLPNYLPPAVGHGHNPSVTSTTMAATDHTHSISGTSADPFTTTEAATDHTYCSGSTSIADCTTTSSAGGQRSAQPSALHSLQECALPRPSHQRFKSPWRWGSVNSRLKYTPIRDKGNVSK